MLGYGQLWLSSSQIAGFFDQQYNWTEPINIFDFLHGDNHLRLPLLVWCGQMCLWSNQIPGFFDHQFIWKESVDTYFRLLSFYLFFIYLLASIKLKYIPYGERFPDPARLDVVLYFRNPVPHFVANLIPPLPPPHPWISEKSFYLRNKWIKSQNMHIIKSCSCLGTMKDKCSLQITKNPLMSLET